MSLTKDQEKALKDILSAAQISTNLSEWEQQFIDDMTDKYEEYGEDLRLSDKQWEILHRIETKA